MIEQGWSVIERVEEIDREEVTTEVILSLQVGGADHTGPPAPG